MTGDAGARESRSRTRRPGRLVLLAVAVLLLLGGGTALAVGIAGQDATPPVPSSTAQSPRVGNGAVSGSRSDEPRPAPAPAAPAPGTAEAAPVARPVSVRIPAIEVRSELITVGLNPDGTLEVPQPGPDYDKAAWFRGSPRPGQTGPAVIEGHVDSAANGPSVFYDLGKLSPGDRVQVGREDGSTATFEVYDIQLFPKDDFPTLAVYGNTDGPELRLITCGGPFNSEARSYEDNVVVFASMVAQTPA